MFEPFPKIARLKRDCVVTEKIDGTNAQVFIHQGPPTDQAMVAVIDDLAIYAGSRNRMLAPGSDNFGFAAWVKQNAAELAALGPGRHFGEWWGLGIQRGYGLHERRFSLFNVNRWQATPPPACCHVVPVLWRGNFESSAFQACIEDLDQMGSRAAPGFTNPEGIVIFHGASRLLFKQTIVNDEAPKGAAELKEAA